MNGPLELAKKRFAATKPGPRLLITGGVHGDEFEPMAAIRRLIKLFEQNQPPLQLLQGSLCLVPVVNESAFLHGNRTAEDMLDLARVCPGRQNGSVTERTAYALSQLIKASDYYIDLHTGGTGLSVLPLVGYSLHRDRDVLQQQRNMARAFNLPIIWGTSANLDGRSLSVARDAGVPAIYAEYRGSAVCDPRGVEAYVTGCLNVMAMLGMIERKLPASLVEHVIEDHRPGSGHMQVCNPSPMTGFFEPAVALGESVQVNQLIGTVVDVLGTSSCEIRSQQAGIVLVLRTFSRVLEGESVGVVAELTSPSH